MGSGGLNKSRYRGVSYDRKKAKWRVQIKAGSARDVVAGGVAGGKMEGLRRGCPSLHASD